MQKWEYKRLAGASVADLNKLGDEGWELVAITFGDYDMNNVYYFKRPKS